MADFPIPSMDDVLEAASRLRGVVHRTPVLTCSTLSRLADANLTFKCENLQKVGAFKFRGASNAVLSLPDAVATRGVATHSSGNHAAALARAAATRGIPAHIVMPRTASAVKRAAVEEYGARITPCQPTLRDREATLERVVRDTGAFFVHPYDNPLVVAGQATAALELLEQTDTLDVIVAPVGGGGLLSGTALAAHGKSPHTRVIGAEPEGADDAFRSLREGRIVPSLNPQTIADGLLTSLGEITFAILRERVDKIITVSDEAILHAMRLVWERMKLVVEPSAAVPLAAVLAHRRELAGLRVGIILSGGNVDLDRLSWNR